MADVLPASDHTFADDGIAAYVTALRVHPGPSARDVGVRRLRVDAATRAAARQPGPELATVRDLVIGGSRRFRVRLYHPASRPRPLLVYFHGGGWVFGGLETHDRTCRRLAQRAGVAVLAVDYRLAPEHPWPAAVEDALAVVRWARREGAGIVGTSVVGVAGDSAGGTIAALSCLWLRDAGEPQPVAQVLVNPHTDLTFSQPSVEEKGVGWGLDAGDARWFAEQWVPDPVRRTDPRVSPLCERDLTDLAPAVIVTAEHDVLRDEGNAYAAALTAAGVPVITRTEPGLVHGFLGMDLVSAAADLAGDRLFEDVHRLLR